jgi:hypothetical protein
MPRKSRKRPISGNQQSSADLQDRPHSGDLAEPLAALAGQTLSRPLAITLAALATLHIVAISVSLLTNREPSNTGLATAKAMAIYLTPTNQDLGRVPLELTHASSYEGPYRIEYAFQDASDANLQWQPLDIGSPADARRLHRDLAILLLTDNGDAASKFVIKLVDSIERQQSKPITNIRFVARTLADWETYITTDGIREGEVQPLFSAKVIKAGGQTRLLEQNESRRASKSLAQP